MGYNEFVEVNCDVNVQLVTTHASVTRADGTHQHCIKSVHIQRYFGPYLPAFGLNTE